MNLSDNARGALMMAAAMAAFTLNDTMLKLVSDDLPLFQAMFLRGVLTTLAFLLLAWRLGALAVAIAPADRRLIGWRVVAETGAAFFFLTALFNMPLANVTAILQALPLTVTLAGALFLRESVGWRRLLAIAVGFVGVMLIVRPDADGFDRFAIMALIAVAFVTLRDLVTRRMSAGVPSMTVALATAGGVTLFALIGGVTEDWARPSPANWAALSGAVVFIIAAYLLSVMAMRVGELGFVSPFRYTGLIWALVLGFLVFGDWPDGVTLLGAALVVGTGLFTLYREHRLARNLARAAQPRA